MPTPDTTDDLDLAAIEAVLAARGVSLSAFCAEADIAFSTWYRWKAKQRRPTRAVWRRVVAAAARHVDAVGRSAPATPQVSA